MLMLVAILAIAPIQLGLCEGDGAESPPEPPPTINLHATGADVAELVELLSRATGTRIVVRAAGSAPVTLSVEDVSIDGALDAVTGAAGLDWTRQGDIIVIRERPADARLEYRVLDDNALALTVREGPAIVPIPPQAGFALTDLVERDPSWTAWRGDLAEELGAEPFIPISCTVDDGRLRLKGSLSGVVEDLTAAGLDISLDPGLTVGTADTAVDLPWTEESTVEQVALRLCVVLSAGDVGVSMVQHKDDEGNLTDRLRIVPANRWGEMFGRMPPPVPPVAAGALRLVEPFIGVDQIDLGRIVLDNATRAYVDAAGALRVDPLGAVAFEPLVENADIPEPMQKRIDLDLKDATLTDALDAIAAELGHPIELADGVNRETTVTVSLKQAPIHQALQTIVLQLGLIPKYERGEAFDGVIVVPLTVFYGTEGPIQPGVNH